MKALALAVAALFVLAFAGAGSSADIDKTKAGLRLSGFYDFYAGGVTDYEADSEPPRR